MKISLIYILLLLILPMGLSAQVTVTGSTGADATYPRLGLAFTAINGTAQTGNKIVISISSSTTETASAVLNSGAWISVKITPTVPGIVISGNLAAPLIDLNGADSVTIDGRVNGVKDMVIDNASTAATAGTSTIRLRNDAAFNVIKYCILKGSETAAGSGIVFFNITTGSDGNLIDNNDITSSADASRPINAIYSLAIVVKAASPNTISNNNIFDHLNRSVSSNGIYLAGNNSLWTISGNSFYETASFVPAVSVAYYMIRINNTGGNYSISGNYIGGNTSLCGGSALIKTNAFNNIFYGIHLTAGTGTSNDIQGNTIRNIDWSNLLNGSWTGIHVARGNVNIGTITGNTIGAATGTGSIVLTDKTNTQNVYGINIASPGNVDCRNNQIGSITVTNADANGCNFYGIFKNNTAGNTTISNNTIGSPDEANSILASSPSTGFAQTVRGIYNAGSGTIIISDNTIANLNNGTTNTTVGTNGRVNGIYSYSASLTNNTTISGNIIQDLTISNANSQRDLNASVCGIALNGTSVKNVTGNTIYNLSNNYTSFTGHVNGLLYMGSTNNNIIDGNFIHSLIVPSSAGASISGIRINTGASTYSNNIIALGGNTLTTIYGIYEYGLAGNNNNLYHNTVYIGGSPASGTNRSYALYSAVNVNSRDFRNNIFANARSTTGGTNLHYAVYIAATGGTIACNYNDYWVSGTGGIMGYYGANKTTLPVVTGQDVNSQAADPAFANAGGTSAADYIPGNCSLAAPLIPAVPNDFVPPPPVTRPDPTLMGAFHVTPCLRVEVYQSSVFQAAYPNLKSAFDAFNAGTHKTGPFEIRIKGDVFEISSAVLNASGTGNAEYSSLIIYPTFPRVKISGSLAAPLIDLNGADNVTIDGRVNATGTTRDVTNMTIANTSTSAVAGTSTVRMINNATNNTVKYCWLRGSETSSNSGVIFFSTSTGTPGNDGNIIDNNYITNADNSKRPVNAIYSLGTVTFENSGNTVSNNDIFDCLSPRITSNVICLSTNSTGWTISGNSFYETTSFVPAGNVTYYIIRINNLGGNYSISGNYIGGGTPLCGNPAWIKSNVFNNVFFGIHITAGTGTSNSIQGNTIRNFDWSNSLNGNWTGIHLLRGNADVGTVTGNTIGAAAGTGSILVTSKTTGNNVYGINIATPGIVNCLNNNIGSITIANADANGSNFYGISKSSGGATKIRNNTIGSSFAANSISATSASTGNDQIVNGIYTTGTALDTISGNIIANLNNYTTNTGSVIGLSFTGNTGNNAVYGNFVHSLSISSSSGRVYGIKTNTGSCTYYNNIITLGGISPATIYGIYETGVAGNNNKIWFNTVNICGTPASGTSSSYAFYSAATNTRDIRNNIFVNSRSTTGGTNLHYAAYIASSGGTITCNYNDYWISGTGGTLGYFGGNKTALPIVTGQDVNSQAADPLFASTGNAPENYLSGVYFPGVTIPAITTDFGGNPRILPTMGAWEGYINTWKGTTSTDWNTGANWGAGQVPLPDADIIFDLTPVNNLVMDQDRSVGNITDSSAFILVTNAHKLTLKGNLYFSSGPKIDATASGATLEFAGDTAQIIEPDRFLDDKAYNLIINNVAGVTLNTDFTVDNILTINPGRVFTINPPGKASTTSLVNNGTLNLNSTSATNIFSLMMDNYSGSGIANVQLFLTGGGYSGNYNWHLVAVPVDGLSKTYFTDINAYNLMAYNDSRVVTSDNNGWSWHDGYGGTPNIPAGGGFSTLSYGHGYNFYSETNATVNFAGMPSLGTTLGTISLQYSGSTPNNPIYGLNLLGNSLTCSLDWNKVVLNGPVSSTVNYIIAQKVSSYNVLVGGTNGATNEIPPLQGFFVQATGTGASIDLTGAKEHSNQPRYKKSGIDQETANDVKNPPKLKLELNGIEGTSDETIVWFNSDATSGFDVKYDGHKLFYPKDRSGKLFSILGGQNYVINGMPLPDDQYIVPLGVKISQSGNYSLIKKDFISPDGYDIWLIDKDKKSLAVNLKNSNQYSFHSDTGIYTDRFFLKIISLSTITKKENLPDKQFNIYASDGMINIGLLNSTEDSSEGEVKIFDLMGRIVKQVPNVEWNGGILVQIALKEQHGIYIVEVTSGVSRQVGKVFLK